MGQPRFQFPILFLLILGVWSSSVKGFVTTTHPMATPSTTRKAHTSFYRSRPEKTNFFRLSLHRYSHCQFQQRGRNPSRRPPPRQRQHVAISMGRRNFVSPKTNNGITRESLYVAVSSLWCGLSALVVSALLEGSCGIVALWGIASAVVIPLTMYRQAYCVSLGYGYSVMSMGIVLLRTFWNNHHALISSAVATTTSAGMLRRRRSAAALVEVISFCSSSAFWLTLALISYGFRLGSFLWMRSVTVESFHPHKSTRRRIPYWSRIPLCLGVSFLYACMSSPVMYGLRGSAAATSEAVALTIATTRSGGAGGAAAVAATGSSTTCNNPFLFLFGMITSSHHNHGQWLQSILSWIGVGMAWTGAGLEALADAQKFLVKFIHEGNDYDFVGPTGWTYRLCRHPNYLGELVFWFGIFVGGAPFFGSSILAWVASGLGLYGIVGIMTTATHVAEKRQDEKYNGQLRYEGWKVEVPGALVPKLFTKKLVL